MSVPLDRALLSLVLALILLYLAPELVTQSQSLDGVVYANVAKLIAAGDGGGFWAMPYFDRSFDGFFDHPPLGVQTLAIWFAALGDAFWVDKAFSLAFLVLVVLAMAWLIRKVQPELPLWWALLALFVMPVTTYALKGNFLEAQLLLPLLFAAYCGWHAWRNLWFAIGLGAGAFVAVSIKGPVGLFPLAALPAALWWYHGRFLQAFKIGAIASAAFAALALALWLATDDAVSFLQRYWSNQVLASITGDRPPEHGRWYLLAQLGINLSSAGIVLGLLSRSFARSRLAGFWLIVALFASLPLLLSARQYRHYLLPALPFYALAIATLVRPPNLERLQTRWTDIAAGTVGAAALVLGVWHWGTPGDHADDLAGARAVSGLLTDRHVGYCPTHADIRLRTYLYRHHDVTTSLSEEEWMLCPTDPAPGFAAEVEGGSVHLWHIVRTRR